MLSKDVVAPLLSMHIAELLKFKSEAGVQLATYRETPKLAMAEGLFRVVNVSVDHDGSSFLEWVVKMVKFHQVYLNMVNAPLKQVDTDT